MKGSGIYKIYSISKPDRVYVGSAVNLYNRKRSHFSELKKGHHGNARLLNHYNKYGKDDLVFVVIEPCFPEYLIVREQYYIDTLNPYFNICKVAGSCLGVKHPDISVKYVGEGNPFYGKQHTDATKKAYSELRCGERNSNYGNGDKIKGDKNPNYGVKATPEKLKKMSEGIKRAWKEGRLKGTKCSDETKTKLSKAMKDRLADPVNHPRYKCKVTDETKQKIRESLNKYHAEKRLAQQN